MAARWTLTYDSQHNPIIYTADTGWGGYTLQYQDWYKVRKAKLPAKASWAVVQKKAMAMIDKADDQHHVFIEGFDVDVAAKIVWISTGS